jgi:hypothetical protein
VEDEESDPQYAADTDFETEVATAPHADRNDRQAGTSGGSK